MLDEQLQQNPDDAEAARLRAQTLYWMKDLDRARIGYAAALERHPADERLRVEYARMLAETGDRRAAKGLLQALRRSGQASAEADTLLGTISYWEGDLTGAERLFLEALQKEPAQREAARQLHEIETASAPWLRLAPTISHDDQPLDRAGVAIEAGWFLSPLLSLAVRSQPDRYSTETGRTFWSNEVEVSHFAPAARLETLLAAGVFRRPGDETDFDWTGRAAVGFRIGGGVTVRGRVERAAYLYTVASLAIPVMTQTATGTLQWTRPAGWLGEAGVQRQRFPDANVVRSAYGWLLAPLVRGEAGRLQAGYAVAGADADEDRFVLARPQQPVPPSDPSFDVAGIYRPYYTPARMVTHSVIAAVTAGKTIGPVLRAGGSYGLRAREDATTLQPVGDQLVATVGRRSYRPWTIRGSLEIPASASLVLKLAGEAGRTAFYRWRTVGFEMVYRFLPDDTGAARIR